LLLYLGARGHTARHHFARAAARPGAGAREPERRPGAGARHSDAL